MMKILVLDNYDSFTFNLVHILEKLGDGISVDVIRNDKISIKDIDPYDKILLSPGPGIPEEAGIMKEVIQNYAKKKSILGICLGHQAIAEVFGAKLFNLNEVLHGMKGKLEIVDKDERLFHGLPQGFDIGHYHSWAVDPESLNEKLIVTSITESGLIMGLRHVEYDVHGLQFHPESIMTEYGEEIMENWLNN